MCIRDRVKHAFNDNTKNKQIYKHMKLIDGETCEFVFKDNGDVYKRQS